MLSYNQLNEYLSVLIENNLIEYIDGTLSGNTKNKLAYNTRTS